MPFLHQLLLRHEQTLSFLVFMFVTVVTTDKSILITVHAPQGTKLFGEMVPVQGLLASITLRTVDVTVSPAPLARRHVLHLL